ncbi:MAG: HAD-IA family hydrolase [Candidatus Babeliales bacterium]
MNTNPNKAIFVFDLHDVLVKKNYPKILRYLVRHCYRIDLLCFFLSPSFIKHIIQLLTTSRVPEHYIVSTAKKYPKFSPFVDVIINMMNEQVPIDDTLGLVAELKNQGHPLYLFSNIGQRTFAQFKQRFPHIVNLFDDVAVAQENDNWIQKPYHEAFEKFIKKFNLSAHQCIFIDNNKRNINTARECGFNTILYQSPEKLAQTLKFKKILI